MSLIRRKDPGQAWETEADTGDGGGSQPAFHPDNRAPVNPASSIWTLQLIADADGGTFTLIITTPGGSPLETGALNWDDSSADLAATIQATVGLESVSVTGAVDLPAGPIQLGFADYGVGHTTVTVGDNSLTPSPDATPNLLETAVGGVGDTGYPEGSGWWNDDDQLAYVNNGDAVTPDWTFIGPYTPSGGFTVVSILPLADGGGGLYVDEINLLLQLDPTSNTSPMIVAAAADPSMTNPSLNNNAVGSLVLLTDGSVWVKTGSGATDYKRLLTTDDLP